MALSLRKRPSPPATGQVRPRARPRLVSVPKAQREAVPRWWRRPRAAYSVLTLAGAALVTVGVALVYVPAALVLAGLTIGGLGMVGLGMQLRGTR